MYIRSLFVLMAALLCITSHADGGSKLSYKFDESIAQITVHKNLYQEYESIIADDGCGLDALEVVNDMGKAVAISFQAQNIECSIRRIYMILKPGERYAITTGMHNIVPEERTPQLKIMLWDCSGKRTVSYTPRYYTKGHAHTTEYRYKKLLLSTLNKALSDEKTSGK